MKTTPIILCIDVEPDDRDLEIEARKRWVGFEETYKFFSELRPLLREATQAPVNFSWFLRMDPQIELGYGSATWVRDQHKSILDELEQAGDEIGLHAHARRWDETAGNWIADYGNQEWVDHCIVSSFEAFQKAFGRRCRSIRIGDHWTNQQTVDLIQRLGAHFDLTVEPGTKPSPDILFAGPYTGTWPNYHGTPTSSYRPSSENFKQPALSSDGTLKLIPLSTGAFEGPKALRMWRVKRLGRFFGIDTQSRRDSTRPGMHIRPWAFQNIFDGLLKIAEAPYIALVVRTDAKISQPQGTNLEENLKHILTHAEVARFRFVVPGNV
jgi:hypothetical protein